MTQQTFPINIQPLQILDLNGKPLASGNVFTYYAGTTNNAITFVDSVGSANNPNPVTLDASGQASIYGQANVNYKIVIQDANGVPIRSQDNVNFGTGLLNGAVLIQGEQTVVGNKIFSGITAFGGGANTEYDSSAAQVVVGAQTSNVAMVELVSNKSINISATTAEGVLNGSLEYDLTTDTWNFRTAGTTRFVLSNTAVSFPTAATFTANGQAFLTNASVVQIAGGGTGQITAAAALIALAPSLTGNNGNALSVSGNTIVWSAGSTGKTVFLPALYEFFNGASQAAWTNFNPGVAGVPNTATSIILQVTGDIDGAGAGGTQMNYVCVRANTSQGLSAGRPEVDAHIALATSIQMISVGGSGCSTRGEYPLYANGTFDYIASTTLTGKNWQQLNMRIVGYHT